MKETAVKEKKNSKKKDEMELVAKFKAYEKQLFDLLKLEPIEFDEKTGKATVKKNIKKYIQKVEQAKIILNEYEKTAHELGECVSAAAENSEAYAKAVIKLRKEPRVKKQDISKQEDNTEKENAEDVQEKSDEKDNNEVEYVLIDGKKVAVKSTKKKSKNSSKQL